jgi:hypothetical protein
MTNLHRYRRSLIVEDLDIHFIAANDPHWPKDLLQGVEPRDLWLVITTSRIGLQFCQKSSIPCFSKDEAVRFLDICPIGTELNLTDELSAEMRLLVHHLLLSHVMVDQHLLDAKPTVAYIVLAELGVYDKTTGSLAGHVLSHFNEDIVSASKAANGESWHIPIALTYCVEKIPQSLAAFAAASFLYNHFMTKDGFSAGYFWRDLEDIIQGVEALAVKSINRAKRAGKEGSKISKNKKEKRRTDLLEKMEILVARNPDIVSFGPDMVAKLAIERCIEENPSIWKQGEGQIIEYLSQIRLGEAGSALQARYQALFGVKPPKRF